MDKTCAFVDKAMNKVAATNFSSLCSNFLFYRITTVSHSPVFFIVQAEIAARMRTLREKQRIKDKGNLARVL